MFTPKPSHNRAELEKAIDMVFEEMKKFGSDTPEYAKMVNQLDKLYTLRGIDPPTRVSLDTLATVTANLVGILLIINHERVNVVATKALGLVQKLR